MTQTLDPYRYLVLPLGALGEKGLLGNKASTNGNTLQSLQCPKWEGHPGTTVNPVKLETGLRPNYAGIPYALVLRIEAIGFPTSGLLL